MKRQYIAPSIEEYIFEEPLMQAFSVYDESGDRVDGSTPADNPEPSEEGGVIWNDAKQGMMGFWD